MEAPLLREDAGRRPRESRREGAKEGGSQRRREGCKSSVDFCRTRHLLRYIALGGFSALLSSAHILDPPSLASPSPSSMAPYHRHQHHLPPNGSFATMANRTTLGLVLTLLFTLLSILTNPHWRHRCDHPSGQIPLLRLQSILHQRYRLPRTCSHRRLHRSQRRKRRLP